jgi:hypothetical protein
LSENGSGGEATSQQHQFALAPHGTNGARFDRALSSSHSRERAVHGNAAVNKSGGRWFEVAPRADLRQNTYPSPASHSSSDSSLTVIGRNLIFGAAKRRMKDVSMRRRKLEELTAVCRVETCLIKRRAGSPFPLTKTRVVGMPTQIGGRHALTPGGVAPTAVAARPFCLRRRKRA